MVALVHPDGRWWSGTNWCRNPQPVCPRGPGEDYTKCTTVCQQAGHAETEAIKKAGKNAAGCTAILFGHTHYCGACQVALREAGVVAMKL